MLPYHATPVRSGVLIRFTRDEFHCPDLADLAWQGTGNLCLDLRVVQSIDEDGLREVQKLARECREAGLRLSLLNVGEELRRSLQAAGLDDLLDLRGVRLSRAMPRPPHLHRARVRER